MKIAVLILLFVCFLSYSPAQEVNSLGIKMIHIKPGSFRLGSPGQETLLPYDRWDEGPIHEVMITRPFLMSATEITNVQY